MVVTAACLSELIIGIIDPLLPQPLNSPALDWFSPRIVLLMLASEN